MTERRTTRRRPSHHASAYQPASLYTILVGILHDALVSPFFELSNTYWGEVADWQGARKCKVDVVRDDLQGPI